MTTHAHLTTIMDAPTFLTFLAGYCRCCGQSRACPRLVEDARMAAARGWKKKAA